MMIPITRGRLNIERRTCVRGGRDPYVGVMLGGTAVLGGSVYLWARESTSASRLSAALLGMGSTAIAAGVVLYLTKQDLRLISRGTSATAALSGYRESVQSRTHVAPSATVRTGSITRLVSVTAGRSFVGAVGTF